MPVVYPMNMNKMKKRIYLFAVVAAIAGIVFMAGCKKDPDPLPLEPIKLVQPDTTVVRLFAGDSLPLQIQFTTDRPINWVRGMYDIDSVDGAYTPTYPDTLFFTRLDTVLPRVNLYTYTGVYRIPDTLNPFDVVRFRIAFEAGRTVFTTGQNYPAGIVSASKEFRIDVR